MDDEQVIKAFLGGDRAGYGPNLHIEAETLFAFGWWHLSFRLQPDAFLVRHFEGGDEKPWVEAVGKALEEKGLHKVMDDHPLVQPITYTEMSLAGPPWSVWAVDEPTGELALMTRAGADSAPRGLTGADSGGIVGDFGAEMEGARRIAGLPPTVVLSVGLPPQRVRELQAILPECRFEHRQFGEIDPWACSDVGAVLMLVDTSEQRGKEFLMELRAAACGRFLPVAAVAPGADLPAGADVILDPAGESNSWKEPLVKLLPD
ncbi:MAG: hypothetical protein ACRDIU_05310 [Actinomycetota bacterium]